MIRQSVLQRADVLRLTAVAALVVCALMTANHLHPERAFCPLSGACAAATQSALGSFFGIPTAVMGLVAFGGLFVLTLLPPLWAHRLAQPAGLLALAAALVFVGYQIYVLKAFCTLCLVADALGFIAGAAALTWPSPAAYAWRGPIRSYGSGPCVLWSSVAVLAVALPLGWPRTPERGWVEIEPLSAAALGLDDLAESDPVQRLATTLDARARSPVPIAEEEDPEPPPTDGPAPSPRPEVVDSPPSRLPPTDLRIAAVAVPLMAEPPPPQVAAPTPEPPMTAAVAPPAPRPVAAPPVPKRPAVLIVEYVNAYCAHCRATHSRLERVLDRVDVPVRRVRVYAWSTQDYPFWARACAHAESTGFGDQLFEELVKASSPHPMQVYAAARRAGMDIPALQQALRNPRPPRRLLRDRTLVKRARLKVLPTLDIGRRRLLGEQSEAELRAAIHAAIPPGGKG